MYHVRFKEDAREAGYMWGDALYRKGIRLLSQVPFPVHERMREFAEECLPFYEKHYPEVLKEIGGIADGQRVKPGELYAVLFGMYCIMPSVCCSCFAFRENGHAILARNSDFLTSIEKLYMNCIYRPEGGYPFQANTTAFVEMEDGINEHGLAIGLTSVYSAAPQYGLNAGMLLRYGLQRCRSVEEFIKALYELPIASAQTFTAVDRKGTVAVIECNPERTAVRFPEEERPFVLSVNAFHLEEMRDFRVTGIDNWRAEERYETILAAFREREEEGAGAVAFAQQVLSGKYGFICQYDRHPGSGAVGRDTVWSVVYDVSEEGQEIWRCEGNPSRKKYKKDSRSKGKETIRR